jgi:hypothetical protein
MGSLHVVLPQPGFRRFSGFANRLEEPAVQAPVPEHTVEALVVTVLPGAAGIDEAVSNALVPDSPLDLLGHELGTIVALHHGRRSVELDQLFENPHDIDRGEVPSTFDPQASTRVLIDHGQEAKRLPVGRLVGHEVVAPDVIRVQRAMRIDRARSASTPFRSPPRHSQPFSTAQQPDALSAHSPTRRRKARMDLPVPEARILEREPMHFGYQRDFFEAA